MIILFIAHVMTLRKSLRPLRNDTDVRRDTPRPSTKASTRAVITENIGSMAIVKNGWGPSAAAAILEVM